MLNEKIFNQARQNSSNSFTPVWNGPLQRKCACGSSSGASQCAECSKKQWVSLQRSTTGNQPEIGVPPIVYDVLRSPGQPLDAQSRTLFDLRFNYDFANVRMNTDRRATETWLRDCARLALPVDSCRLVTTNRGPR